MQQFILYQAYGSPDHINECRYSLLKFLQVYNLKPPPEIGLVIYTDQPQLFEAFTTFFHDFRMQPIDEALVRQWRGQIDFVHRVKIAVLMDFMSRQSGAVLYCDTDTYMRRPVEPIFESLARGGQFLHAYEGVIDSAQSPNLHKWERFLSANTISYNGKILHFSRSLKLWNAGVVGLNSEKHRELLEDVLALTDTIYRQFPKHIAEQFAFSYCLQKKGEVQSAEDVILHYWNLKEFRSLLQAFFRRNEEESIPNLVKMVRDLDAGSIQQEKNAFVQLPFYQKWWRTLSGRRWSIGKYVREW